VRSAINVGALVVLITTTGLNVGTYQKNHAQKIDVQFNKENEMKLNEALKLTIKQKVGKYSKTMNQDFTTRQIVDDLIKVQISLNPKLAGREQLDIIPFDLYWDIEELVFEFWPE
jgi:hypothetical protein